MDITNIDAKERFIKTVFRVGLVIAGSLVSSFGIVAFLESHKMLTTGVAGLAMLTSYFIPINAGVLIIVFNIPLFILAWKKIDINFCIYSIVGVVSLSLMMVLFERLGTTYAHVENPLLAAIFGGIMCGGGTGIVMRARGSHGGTDILAIILRQKTSISIGMIGFYLNFAIVVVLMLKYGLESGLLTIFAQYISAKSLDYVVTGFNTAKSLIIISDKPDEIADYIMNKMYRGVTVLQGRGGYTGAEKKVLWCVVTTSQLARIKAAVKKIDPNGFMIISDASEIIGEGFYQIPF